MYFNLTILLLIVVGIIVLIVGIIKKNKAIILSSAIALLIILGFFLVTAGGQIFEKGTVIAPTSSTPVESTVFENELFSLRVPAPYIVDDTRIQAKNKKDFPTFVRFIILGGAKERVGTNKLLEFTENELKIKCEQIELCGKIISSKIIKIDGKETLKFTVQYSGRSLDDGSGIRNEYHYSIVNGENLFQFWASASDLENPEEVSKKFDKIMETISFSLKKYSDENYTFEYPQAYVIKQKTQPVSVIVEAKNGKLEIFQLKSSNGERITEIDRPDEFDVVGPTPLQKMKVVENKQTWFDVWMYYDTNDKQTEDELMAIFDSIKLK